MAAARARHGSYLFQRPGSSNYYIKLRSPGKRVEISLGTPDKLQAERLALPHIDAHKAALIAARPRVEQSWRPALEPGRLHAAPDGGQIFATERELHYLAHNGNPPRVEPNGGMGFQLIGEPLNVHSLAEAFLNADFGSGSAKRPTVATKDADDAIMATYLTHNGISGYREREANDMWHIFKTVVGKPLRECDRNDGRAIIAHLEDQADDDEPLKSATLRRRMVPLVAAVNLAIKEGKHKGINPFSGVVQIRKDADECDAFDDNDMKIIRANLHKLSPNDQLLVRTVATTGMRRGEAFEIAREKTEDAIRYCVIGTKTDASYRRVPFPKDLLPQLPKKITGPLFTGRKDAASKRLRAFLIDIGIINENDGRYIRPFHSFRHRAKKRLRRAVPDGELRNAIGGWTDGKKDSGVTYGKKDDDKGYPMKMLKKAIDRIGF
jgi:integrase